MKTKQKKYVKKYSRFTDNKIRKNKSIMSYRLDGSMRERAALNLLLKMKGMENLMDTIYSVLSMRKELFMPKNTTPLEEEWGKKFVENKEIVDRVVHTLFQWFGTNVGWAELQKIAEVLKEWPNEPSGRLKKSIEKQKIDALNTLRTMKKPS